MMDFVVAPLVVGIITLGIYKLFELFVRKRERLTIIEKLGDKLTAPIEWSRLSLPGYRGTRFSFGSLKVGCLLMGIGLGLLTGFFVNIYTLVNLRYLVTEEVMSNWEVQQVTSVAYGASVLFLGGAGLIVAFIIEKKKREREDTSTC
ncbi:hypothetical protein EZS27_004627 [termite gut metagenome]|uniref:DUF6249 domain-containing protein n=1 Tax=termite gut metagenome TaxID=433724 RepID=A0A5J4SP23_9ZZZZ